METQRGREREREKETSGSKGDTASVNQPIHRHETTLLGITLCKQTYIYIYVYLSLYSKYNAYGHKLINNMLTRAGATEQCCTMGTRIAILSSLPSAPSIPHVAYNFSRKRYTKLYNMLIRLTSRLAQELERDNATPHKSIIAYDKRRAPKYWSTTALHHQTL